MPTVYKNARKLYRKYKKGGVRKVAKYTGKAVYNRYAKGGMGQLVKDVGMLKAMVNTEKKYFEQTYSSSFGQVVGNSTGCSFIDITPFPTQNVTYNGRTGQSIKLVSASLNIIINNQNAQRIGQNIRFEIYYIKGDPKNLVAMGSELYDVNPLTTIVDYMSNRNPNNFSDFQKICVRKVFYPSEQHTAENSRQKTLKINLKLNHHLRFDKNSTGLISGQVYIFAVTESGNCSAVVTSTTPYIQNAATGTGFLYSMHSRFYYVDN